MYLSLRLSGDHFQCGKSNTFSSSNNAFWVLESVPSRLMSLRSTTIVKGLPTSCARHKYVVTC